MSLIKISSANSASLQRDVARVNSLIWSAQHRAEGLCRPMTHAVVIPAYNEAERISPTIESIYDFFSSRREDPFEVIVVDSGSDDNTREVVERCRSVFPNLFLTPKDPGFGKGFSVKHGMLASAADRTLFMDADGSTPITELDKLDDALESGYDVAIGSRSLKESDIRIHQPFYREAMGRMFNFLVKLSSGLNFEDTQCGFKAFTRTSGADIFSRLRMDGFAFDVEALYLAEKLGYKVAEVPITWADSPRSTVNPLFDPAKMFLDVMRVRWMHRGCR